MNLTPGKMTFRRRELTGRQVGTLAKRVSLMPGMDLGKKLLGSYFLGADETKRP